MPDVADARRRWFGLLFHLLAAGMLIWGQTLLKPHLRGLVFVVYWLGCFAFTGLALLTALLDLWIVRLRSRRERRELLERTLGEFTPPTEDREQREQKPPRK
jgi:hypothetical protein